MGYGEQDRSVERSKKSFEEGAKIRKGLEKSKMNTGNFASSKKAVEVKAAPTKAEVMQWKVNAITEHMNTAPVQDGKRVDHFWSGNSEFTIQQWYKDAVSYVSLLAYDDIKRTDVQTIRSYDGKTKKHALTRFIKPNNIISGAINRWNGKEPTESLPADLAHVDAFVNSVMNALRLSPSEMPKQDTQPAAVAPEKPPVKKQETKQDQAPKERVVGTIKLETKARPLDVKLSPAEQKIATELMARDKRITKEFVSVTIAGMRDAGLIVNKKTVALSIAIALNEGAGAVDVCKTKQQMEEKIKEFEGKIDDLGWVLTGDVQDFFDKKATAFKAEFSYRDKTSQYEIFVWMQNFKNDILNSPLNKDIQSQLNDSLILSNKLADKKIGSETNYDFFMRNLNGTPKTFGKYEINPDLMVRRGVVSNNTDFLRTVGWNPATGTYNKLAVVAAMQGRNSPIDQVTLEKFYQSVWFRPGFEMYDADGDGTLNRTESMFYVAEQNAGLYACRNAGIQNALNVRLGATLDKKLTLDGDLTTYDATGKPVYNENSSTVKALLLFCENFPAKYTVPEKAVREFVELSRSPQLGGNPQKYKGLALYNDLMTGQKERFVLPSGINTGKTRSIQRYAQDAVWNVDRLAT